VKTLKIDNVKLNREMEQLRLAKMKEFDHRGEYQRLMNEREDMERLKIEYEAKYSDLLDSYTVRIYCHIILYLSVVNMYVYYTLVADCVL